MPETIVLLNPPSPELQIRDLYCSITSKGTYCWPPIDLLIASGFLKDRFDLLVIDAIAERLSVEIVLQRIRAAKPAGVLSMTGSASLSSDFEFFARLKRAGPARLVVTGDVAVDAKKSVLQRCPQIDAVWTDLTSSGILRCFSERQSRDPIPGIAFTTTDGQAEAGRSEEKTFSYPVPRHDLFPLNRYRLPYAHRGPFTSVLTSFGCPFTCSYCIQNKSVMGHRRRPVEETMRELIHLRSLGIRGVYFRDPLFESNRDNALELCAAMQRERLGLRWSCNCRTDTVDAPLLQAMKKAGCTCVAFGFESSNEELLRRHRKSTTLSAARRAVALCRESGISVAGYWILGLPGETYEAALETIEFAVSIGIDYASFSLPSPDYGTQLRALAIDGGKIAPDLHSFNRSRPANAVSDLSNEQLARLKSAAFRRFYLRPEYFVKALLRVRSPAQLWDSLENLGIICKTCADPNRA